MPFVFTLPKLSPTMEEGAIAKWHKKEGEHVEANEVIVDITTDKATIEHPLLDGGWVRKILIPEGKIIAVNTPLAIVAATKEEDISALLEKVSAKKEVIKQEESPIQTQDKETLGTRIEPFFEPEPPLVEMPKERKEHPSVSPRAKKIALEKKLDLSYIAGSGPGGRIEERDLEHAKTKGFVSWQAATPQLPGGSFEEIELTPLRKAVGQRLSQSKSFVPHFYVKQSINADALVRIKSELESCGLKISYNDLIIRGCALALEHHPVLNRGYNSKNQTIIQFQTIDIAVAVSLQGGLITPIIRHANCKRVAEIAQEMSDLKGRAQEGKLKEYEYKGGSFTLSNLGMFGISEFIAVINPPQAAILAVAGIEDKAVVYQGVVRAGKELQLVLSCDHRVIDGSDAAQFLSTLKKLLESPAGLII